MLLHQRSTRFIACAGRRAGKVSACELPHSEVSLSGLLLCADWVPKTENSAVETRLHQDELLMIAISRKLHPGSRFVELLLPFNARYKTVGARLLRVSFFHPATDSPDTRSCCHSPKCMRRCAAQVASPTEHLQLTKSDVVVASIYAKDALYAFQLKTIQ